MIVRMIALARLTVDSKIDPARRCRFNSNTIPESAECLQIISKA
jgi:hypothetical protein